MQSYSTNMSYYIYYLIPTHQIKCHFNKQLTTPPLSWITWHCCGELFFKTNIQGFFFWKTLLFSKNLSPEYSGDKPQNPNLIYLMKIVPIIIGIVFITYKRQLVIPEKNRIRIEKYIIPSTRDQKQFIETLCHLCQPWTHPHPGLKDTNSIGGRIGNNHFRKFRKVYQPK